NSSVEGCPSTATFGSLPFTPPTASDACGAVSVNIVSDVTGGTACTITPYTTLFRSDGCGNTSSNVSQTITVHDTTAPTIGAAGAYSAVEGCPGTATFGSLPTRRSSARDACGAVSVNIVSDVTGGTACAKTFTRTWNAVDACGNTSSNVSQTITVHDTTAPTIGAAGANSAVEGCPGTATFGSLTFTPPTASDSCGAESVNIVSDLTGGTACAKTFTRTWNAVDGCGNTSRSVS